MSYGKICRLAVVANGFNTYYMPHTTHIGGDRIGEITESEGEFYIINLKGRIIGVISKTMPHLVDYYREKTVEELEHAKIEVDASSHEEYPDV